jgi:hypothetical protein
MTPYSPLEVHRASEENIASIFSRALLATYFHASFLLGLFFDPEDGGGIFLRNARVAFQLSNK